MRDLFNKRLVFEVRASYAEVEDVHPLHDGVVESIQEPRRVRDLKTQSEDEDGTNRCKSISR